PREGRRPRDPWHITMKSGQRSLRSLERIICVSSSNCSTALMSSMIQHKKSCPQKIDPEPLPLLDFSISSLSPMGSVRSFCGQLIHFLFFNFRADYFSPVSDFPGRLFLFLSDMTRVPATSSCRITPV